MKKTFTYFFFHLALLFCVFGQNTFEKRTYYDEEEIRVKEIITLLKVDSVLHGRYQSLYINGSLAIQGYYDHGTSDSLWNYYYENGREKARGSYEGGNQSGQWEYFYESGEKKAQGTYSSDARHGSWIYYFENGQKKSAGIYYHDLKDGIWNYFYEDSNLKAQAYFQQGKGTYSEFYPNGKLKYTGQNAHDKSEGEWTYYFESGELEARGDFENGLRNGLWKYYHENGQISGEGHFLSGEKSGVWKYYFPDGSISSQGSMIEDAKDGFWKLYYQTGEIKGEGNYNKGTGEYTEYYASGKQKSRGSIVDGLREGEWKFYNEDGIEDGTANFENGAGNYVGKYPDGTLKMTGKIEDDKRVGEWTLYNPDGTVAGIYRPVYEEQQPIFRTAIVAKQDDKKRLPDKPEYRYKNKKLRYFDPTINEYTGLILGTNPLATIYNQLPISLEYYIQERLGHELQLTLLNNPFFNRSSRINAVNSLGLNLDIKQKFYHKDTQIGMLYFGHQLRGGYSQHQAKVLDSLTSTPTQQFRINSKEYRFGYGIFLGDRWMQRAGDSGLTFDLNIGMMIGQRDFLMPFDQSFHFLFNELNQDKFYLPVIFTLNIGYAGPKRRSTSF